MKFSKIQFGDGLTVTDLGDNVVRIDAGAVAGATFTWTQTAPSATWNVIHNLASYPAVTVVDTGDTEVIPDLHYIDQNSLVLSFGSPTSGKAYLN